MTCFNPETQAELNRQRMNEEIQTIRLQNKALKGRNLMNRGLAVLGAWMVARGEKLRSKNAGPQTYYTDLHKKPVHR